MGEKKYIKIIPIYLLLIFFPCIFGLLLYIFVLNIDKNLEISKIKTELSDRATDFLKKTTPVDYFEPYFKKLAKKITPFFENIPNKDGVFMTPEEVTKEIKACEKNFKDIEIRFVCAIFDNDSNLINPKDLDDAECRFFTFAWKELHGIPNADYPNRLVDQNRIIGREFKNRQMYGKDEYCMPTFSVGKTGVIYEKRGSKDKNGVLIFVEHKNTGLLVTDLTIAKEKVKDYSTYEKPIILYNLESKKRETSTLGHKEIPFIKTCNNEFYKGFLDNNIVWLGINSDYYKILLGQKFNNYQSYRKRFIFSILIFLIILIASTAIFLKNLSTSRGMYISIKYKLVLLFGLAIYMPTLCLWVLSYTSLGDHKTAIENNVKRGMLDIANKIDSDYKKSEDRILQSFFKFDEYLRSFKGKEPPSNDEIWEKLEEIVGKNNKRTEIFNWLDIRHINLSQIFTTQDEVGNERLEKIGRIFAIICLSKYCPERLEYEGKKPTQSDILVGNLFENPMVGFASIFERPKKLNFLNFDGQGVYWWWNYYPEKDNPIAFCIGTSILKESTIAYFKFISKQRYYIDNIHINVINFHYGFQQFEPMVETNEKELLSLINVSNKNKTIESSIINFNNKDYISICVPGSNLKECFITCMYPESEINNQIEKIRSVIYKVMILLFIISIFTGLLLAKTFLLPINELNKGLTALKKRETNTVINIDNNDELGQLGNSFNKMMLDIKDMLLAGAIQQCLIPSGEYKIDGYDCLIYNQMAIDVGGDYADFFELPNDRLLVVIGDVTGHGVSSALLTAMVKASIFGFVKDNTPLNEIVNFTSNMICDLLNKKKLMTFCAISLDKKTGEMGICNAGHPYPIIREKEKGFIRMPSKNSIPMGVSKKRSNYISESETLKPGETLFLYTDGFPEAVDSNGKEYGYDNFQQLIANSEETSLESLKDHLLNVFKDFHGDAELIDDITFVILRRKPF